MNRLLLFFTALLLSFSSFAQHSYYLLVGTYTSNTSSKGIYVYRFNALTGDISPVSVAAGISDPSYLAISPDNKFVYAVNEANNHEGSGGHVTALRFDREKGTLSEINRVPSGGDDPCYVAVHNSDKWIAVANYSSGSFSVLPIQADGSLAAPVINIRHTGSGPNKARQEMPHVHSTVFSPDGQYLYVADLGLDLESVYKFRPRDGMVCPAPFPAIHAKPGVGPRHFIFHPNGRFAYCTEEMGGSVSVYAVKNGALRFLQRLSNLPADFKGDNTSADVHLSPDGKFLYTSNRGESNLIAIFRIDQQSGLLHTVGFQSVLGNFPRNFNLDPEGNFVLVANQKSNEIVIFRRNKESGKLTDTGKRVEVGAPVCLKWIPAS